MQRFLVWIQKEVPHDKAPRFFLTMLGINVLFYGLPLGCLLLYNWSKYQQLNPWIAPEAAIFAPLILFFAPIIYGLILGLPIEIVFRTIPLSLATKTKNVYVVLAVVIATSAAQVLLVPGLLYADFQWNKLVFNLGNLVFLLWPLNLSCFYLKYNGWNKDVNKIIEATCLTFMLALANITILYFTLGFIALFSWF